VADGERKQASKCTGKRSRNEEISDSEGEFALGVEESQVNGHSGE